MLFLCGSYSANIVLIVSNLLIVLSIICNKIRSILISSPCHFYFVLYCFIDFSWSPLPLRSAQSRGPPDLLWSSLRYGRCKADIHRMSCTLVFALIRVRKHWWDRYNTRETIRENSPVTNPVFSRVCGEFNNKI